MEMPAKLNIAIVGATGAVGREVLSILLQRSFPIKRLRLFSSARNVGQKIKFGVTQVILEELTEQEPFTDLDLVFFTASSAVSQRHAPRAAAAGALAIDNASVFRMDPDVPLVVPEVNGHTLEQAREKRLVANPNCTTAQMVMALKPLHDRFRIKRVILSSYQAVSGKGQKGIDEFKTQVREFVEGRKPTVDAFAHPIAFNALPHIDAFRPDGFTDEEYKVMEETKKILGDATIRVLATCVRVPVVNCHSESITIETEKPVTPEQARAALQAMPGVTLFDDPATNTYPLAMDVSGKDEVYVGRIRPDPSLLVGEYGLTLWVVADNLRKGAALNAVQIAEAAIERGLLRR